mgnify:CR=1 FL=1
MRPWSTRVREEANLLNPPFCSLLVTLATEHYQRAVKAPMPYVYPFLILPMVLHKATREGLPKSTLKMLSTWIEENPTYRALLPDNMRALRPFVQEALLYGLVHGCFGLDADGNLSLGKKPRGIAGYETGSSSEVRDCLKRAQFVGRWLATAGPVPTVMSLWGIRP